MTFNLKEQIQIGLEFHQAGKLADAENAYTEILKECPQNPNTLNLLGILKLQQGKNTEAIDLIKKAVEANPCSYFLENLGRAYAEGKNFEEAINCYKKSLELEPNSFEAFFNLGFAYKEIGQIDDAIKSYEKALSIKSDNPEAYFNLGNIYEKRNETFKALENYKKAYEYDPKNEDINYFLGEACLKAKNFKEGWFHYEHRASKGCAILTQKLQYKEVETKPLWQGEELKDKTLFLYYESALGDTLMYARFFPAIVEKFKKVLFKPQLCFMEFFKENNFGMEIIDTRTLPQDVIFDTHIPLMSIPYVLGINSEADIPHSEGYLKAKQEKVQAYKEKFFNNDKFKIGIKWQGNRAYSLERIIPLKAFYKIFELPNVQFYSVQKGDGSEELADLPGNFEITSLGDSFKDFSDTAAAIENFDLVICNDTSIAHLAGAMGKPCWVLLPFVQNWRWATDLTYSPWYKSVKLFKQIQPENWNEVFDRVCEELKGLL